MGIDTRRKHFKIYVGLAANFASLVLSSLAESRWGNLDYTVLVGGEGDAIKA